MVLVTRGTIRHGGPSVQFIYFTNFKRQYKLLIYNQIEILEDSYTIEKIYN